MVVGYPLGYRVGDIASPPITQVSSSVRLESMPWATHTWVSMSPMAIKNSNTFQAVLIGR